MIERRLYRAAWEELAAEKAMVLLAGPRQAGKTTLAESLAESFTNHVIVNWDVTTDRKRLLAEPYFFAELPRRDDTKPLVVFESTARCSSWKRSAAILNLRRH